ncbi:Zn-dependent protease with chaperone function [Brevibacterium siliguriense]|uniref:Zn-dependent protease with chaperone function n=1 Tax=Brevibacterium siliguriense TaxID=1136497 RepID=A0A1H1QGC4_9MICO|nr:M56 family metallopeptidase [Brevibacterium siliguriense]SDS22363.1 Zn-dependent protease with chaperone function [Brevibacterium siliguriense]
MSLLIGGACVAALAFVLAWAGPALVRSAAPVLMRVPRVAVFALLSLPLLSWAVVTALSLMAAWLLKGPDVLPVRIGDVCQRCLIAASPFGGAQIDTLIPVVLFLLLPLLVTVGFLIRGGLLARRRHRENVATARILGQEAVDVELAGRTVRMISGHRHLAFSLPRRYGGVVVSENLCSALEPSELTAVLEHERAHVDQGHHGIMALVETFVRPLRFIPLFAEVAASVPLYLEIAADDRARKVAGTPALAGALLKIGPHVGEGSHLGGSYALNIAGPDRVRQLVAPVRMSPGLLPTAALSSALTAFCVLFSSVIATYIGVLLTGCTLP